jgi:hypothetical protein
MALHLFKTVKAKAIVIAVLAVGNMAYAQSPGTVASKHPKTPEELFKLVEARGNAEYDAWMRKWKDQPLPPFSLTDLNGNTVTGKVLRTK